MDMAAPLANSALRAAIPGLWVEQVGDRRGELNLLLPKDAVAADRAVKRAALNHDGSKALGIGRHIRVPLRNIQYACVRRQLHFMRSRTGLAMSSTYRVLANLGRPSYGACLSFI
jgi:hypothetical protein